MAYNLDHNASSDEDRYKLNDGFSSEGMDSETETTLLGYVHYNSVTVSSKAKPDGSPKITPETETQDPLKDEGAHTDLKEVTVSIQPTQPIVEVPRERFVAASSHFALRSRYFSDPRLDKCYICNKPGHTSITCSFSKQGCSQCKDPYHAISECPWTLCTNCKQFGHSELICSSNSTELSCSHCNSSKHDTKSCRVFWREYSDLKQPKISGRLPKWCYQCGEMNHFGDSCDFGFVAHTTSFWGKDPVDPKGKTRISHVHAYFTEPIFSDLAPETAASAPESKSRFRNYNSHSNINQRLSFSSNTDRYRSFTSRDSFIQSRQNKKNLNDASSSRNGPRNGYYR